MNYKKTGDKLKQLRKEAGISQKELASKLNHSESFISYVENGLRNMNIRDLKKIAEIFNVDYNIFLDDFQSNMGVHFRTNSNKHNEINADKILDDFIRHAIEVKNKKNNL